MTYDQNLHDHHEEGRVMRIQWLAHASFLIESNSLRIITDPYEPNDVMNLPPITEKADIVVRSSDDDDAHCYVDTIPPGFELVTATHIVDSGAVVRGIPFSAVWSMESVDKQDIVRDNAMYRFEIEGIQVTHLGDVGNPLTDEQVTALMGTDVMLVLAGGFPTIELDDLDKVISAVKPRIVIPMHYRIPGPRFFMRPVSDFVERYPDNMVVHHDETSMIITADSLPESTTIHVLKPTLFRGEQEFSEEA